MIPGGWELVVIVLVVVLLFGSKKLPELARSVGKAGKAFKEETGGLRKDTDQQNTATPPPAPAQLPTTQPAQQPAQNSQPAKPDVVQ